MLAYSLSFCLSASDGLRINYVVGVEKQPYAPYFYIEDDQYLGFARELLDRFANAKNITFEYKPYSINELFPALKNDEVHFKFPDSPSWKYPQKMGVKWYYSDPVVPYIDGALVNSFDQRNGIKNLKKIGTITGFTPWGYHHLIQYNKLDLVESDNIDGLVTLLLSRDVDAIYANVQVLVHHLRMNRPASFAKISFNTNLPYTKHQYLLSTIKEQAVLNQFNQFLKDFKFIFI